MILTLTLTLTLTLALTLALTQHTLILKVIDRHGAYTLKRSLVTLEPAPLLAQSNLLLQGLERSPNPDPNPNPNPIYCFKVSGGVLVTRGE